MYAAEGVEEIGKGIIRELGSLLKESRIRSGIFIIREKFKQFIPYSTGFHGNDEL